MILMMLKILLPPNVAHFRKDIKLLENTPKIKLFHFIISNTHKSNLDCLCIIACLTQSFPLSAQ